MTLVFGSPFRIDWTNLNQVIEYAERLGPGMSVIKYPHRPNYNITHTSRVNRECKVIYQTERRKPWL